MASKRVLSLILMSCLASLPCLGILLAYHGLRGGPAVSESRATEVASPMPSPTLRPAFTPALAAGFAPTAVALSPTPTHTPFAFTPASASTRVPASGPPTRIMAPAIGLDAKVIEVGWEIVEGKEGLMTIWEMADYAAGFHRGSAYPGHGGNIVISGHHNTKGEVFRYLVDLELGDEIFLYVGDARYRYIVEKKLLVREEGVSEEQRRENAKWIGPFTDERLTLVTCWPYTGLTHRVIVIAKPPAP